jgi:hypothetical protein
MRTSKGTLPLHHAAVTPITMFLPSAPEPAVLSAANFGTRARRFPASNSERRSPSKRLDRGKPQWRIYMTYDPNSDPNSFATRDPNRVPPRSDAGNSGWIVGAIIVVLLIVGLFYWGSNRTDTASNTMAPAPSTTIGSGTTTPVAPRTTTGSGTTSTLPSAAAPTDRAPAPTATPPAAPAK